MSVERTGEGRLEVLDVPGVVGGNQDVVHVDQDANAAAVVCSGKQIGLCL